jgi:hypothetical protein
VAFIPAYTLTGAFGFTTNPGIGAGLHVAFVISPEVSIYGGIEGATAPSDEFEETPGSVSVSGGNFLGGYSRTSVEVGARTVFPTGAGVRPMVRAALIGMSKRLDREPNILFPEAERQVRGAGLTFGAGAVVDVAEAFELEVAADVSLLQLGGVGPEDFGNAVRNEIVSPRVGIGLVYRP